MYCPQCGTESSSDQRFCRSCGANLKVIGKAVALSEAIARSDRGPLPKIKEMMKSLKVEQTTDEVSNALDEMNREITRDLSPAEQGRSAPKQRAEAEPPELRRENHIVKGAVSLFTGIALMIFLYFFARSLVLKIPPEKLERIPFELEPVLKIIWLVGLIPALSGMGRIIAGLMVRRPALEAPSIKETPSVEGAGRRAEPLLEERPAPEFQPGSVTEGTTELLSTPNRARPDAE